ncbi:MAG: M13 family metallopeptidase [Hyphomonadaceae bacterium]|nr:M13 family metallopeptidase [Hyphomonadaceae bacterium]
MSASLLQRLGLMAAAASLALAACAAPTAPALPPGIAVAPKLIGEETTSAERPAFGDDFYGHVNHDWLSTYKLPADKSSSGATEELTEAVEANVRRMIEEIAASKPAPGTVDQKIADIYTAALDEAAIEARGIAPLRPHLDRMRAAQTYEDIVRLMGVIGYNAPFGIDVDASPDDPGSNAVWISQAGLGMPNHGYYIDGGIEALPLQAAYRKHVATILKLLGNPDPEEGAKRIYALERRLAEAHTYEDRSISIADAMRPMTYAELKAFAPGFDWDIFLDSTGFAGADSFVITDQTAVTDLAKLVRRISVADWRLWLEYHFASDFSPYLPKAFRETTFDFFSRQLYGVTEEPERWKFAVAVVEEQLGEAVAQLYVARYFPPEHKTRIDGLVRNIRLAFETRIRGLDWMDNETRNAALEKLAALQGMIGHPETWRDYSGYTVEPGKLVEAVYASYEFYWSEQQLDLHRPVDRKRWIAPAHVVNAFYNPLANSFVLPAGILQPPYFSPDADAAENYGGIGAVIGHQMSHGFDDEGRQSDAAGRTRNWWTEETDERFRAKSYRLIEQYDGYCPWFGACVNGLGTLGENIGDLAGLEIAYAAYRMSLGETEAPVIGGLTGDQRFFIAYARTYRDKVREELARAMLDSDNHAPSRYRVNGVVRNMDAWYAAFDIKPGDRLYLAPNQRVRIW